jgi:predicted RNase H-like nuclease (RuvC/YqgF family)
MTEQASLEKMRQDISEIRGTLAVVAANQERMADMMERLIRQEERIARIERDVEPLPGKIQEIEKRCVERAYVPKKLSSLEKQLHENDQATTRASMVTRIIEKGTYAIFGGLAAVIMGKLFGR